MQLTIKPYHKSSFPLKGILIKSNVVLDWLKEMQRMELYLEEVETYSIPGKEANSLWGCLVIINDQTKKIDAGINEYCQLMNERLFIPERSILFPAIAPEEIGTLFHNNKHIIHPEFGLIELTELVNWTVLLKAPTENAVAIQTPSASVFIPSRIKSFQVASISPDDELERLEQDITPQQKAFKDEPLNGFEKTKLLFYKLLFGKKTSNGKNGSAATGTQAPKETLIERLMAKLGGKWANKLQQDFDNLEERNKKHVDKLMDLFKKDPLEALKYAIPLDSNGANRGGMKKGLLDLSQKNVDFSLFSGSHWSSGRGGTIDIGDHFYVLQKQYYDTAAELIKQKEYEKAAFIYMKLLKNHHQAATTLEAGSMYKEAAAIHLKYTQNKPKAAECYEKANMTQDAIDLYKELNENEKVGDLYLNLNKRKEADLYFEKVAQSHIYKDNYVKAALIYRRKMEQIDLAQEILLKGWREAKDSVNCLNNYFVNIDDEHVLSKELTRVYSEEVNARNRARFLEVIKHEYKKNGVNSGTVRDMAYEIIAAELQKHPAITSELKDFNQKDPELVKDVMRFKLNKKRG